MCNFINLTMFIVFLLKLSLLSFFDVFYSIITYKSLLSYITPFIFFLSIIIFSKLTELAKNLNII